MDLDHATRPPAALPMMDADEKPRAFQEAAAAATDDYWTPSSSSKNTLPPRKSQVYLLYFAFFLLTCLLALPAFLALLNQNTNADASAPGRDDDRDGTSSPPSARVRFE